MCPHYDDDDPIFSFVTDIGHGHLDWQISFGTQIFLALRAVLSEVEHLSLKFSRDFKVSETDDDIDPTQWHELLRLFNDVKILRVDEFSLWPILRSLEVGDGGLPLGLLPELKELQCPSQLRYGRLSRKLIDARQKAGRPVTLVDYGFTWEQL